MNKAKKNHQGFGAVEVLLIIIVFIVVAGVGYHFYNTANKTNQSENNDPYIVAGCKIGSTTCSNGGSEGINLTDASNLLMTFYQKYSAFVPSSPNDTTTWASIVKQYGTTNLITYDTKTYNEDPIVCAQAMPSSIHVTNMIQTSLTGASGIVNEVFGTESQQIKVTVADDSGTLKIDSVTCPGSNLIQTNGATT